MNSAIESLAWKLIGAALVGWFVVAGLKWLVIGG